MVTARDISGAVQALDLSGRPLCIHASLSSFGWVEGGAGAVVDGLLAEGCTVMAPTFSWVFAVAHPGTGPAQNAWDYEEYSGHTTGMDRVYTTDTSEIDRDDMGAIAAEIVARPGRSRGDHPLCSFAAVGPLAEALTQGQRALDVWSPLRALAQMGGSAVLMGVGLERMSLLHLAEQMAGRNQFRRWANGPDARPMEVEAGGCSGGFERFAPLLAPVMRTREVGPSLWRVFPAGDTLDIAAAAIRERPMVTHCGDAECGRCRDATAGGPILDR
jgi:aminoglycoside 3-N-acetyltransferase